MKRVILSFVFLFIVSGIIAQDNSLSRYFDVKLRDIESIIPEKQEYDVVIKKQILHPIEKMVYFTDALKATFRVHGTDSVVWHNVGWSRIDDLLQEPVQIVNWDEFNGRTHKTGSTDWLNEKFYSNIPQDKREWARMMTSDVPWLEFGKFIIDSLEFQKDYFPQIMDNKDIAVEGSNTFSSSYLKCVWSGITLCNDEICAIVKFESLNSQLISYSGDKIVMKGRDMYYGEILVSLNDKQIERLVMVEDLVGENQFDKNLFEMQRIVTFNKVK
ncbi:MAG: hypothetical protein VB074_02580 [Proteiniphilum sp.]|jgi:hypothetical protein|uniref:hypothetical protein n=1 Tax=Proteiniphilum sp. TaxID=1926877 RepID=UPI002B1ED755|nr:hypothetical protein [Proteiniphilum sp.]MEA5127047.1 hypothetical protein [Proteiniphilum sp.]